MFHIVELNLICLTKREDIALNEPVYYSVTAKGRWSTPQAWCTAGSLPMTSSVVRERCTMDLIASTKAAGSMVW